MEYLWKQNKGFILAVGGGALLVLSWYWWVLTPINAAAEKARRDRQIEENGLKARMAGGVPNDDLLARAERDLQRTRELLASLSTDLQAPAKPPFVAAAKGQAAQYFGNLHLDRWTQISEQAVGARVTLAQRESPFGRVVNATEEAASELLLRLALVDRLCKLCIDAGVEKIENVNPTAEVQIKEEATADRERFLNALLVNVKLRGSSASIFKVVHGLQKKGDFYAITSFSAEKEGEHEDLFLCEFQAAALLVDASKPIAAARD